MSDSADISLLDKQAKNIRWLEFELSNNCQLARQHTWCPRNQDGRDLVFLKSAIIKDVVDFFSQYDFYGRVFLSGYSEPLIDPRLTELVKYIKVMMPRSHIFMFTNGMACDENLLMDVKNAGVEQIIISQYPENRHRRMADFAKLPGVTLRKREVGPGDDDIDPRLHVYNEDVEGVGGPCFMPSLYYFVRNNGDVNMCFWDWKYTVIFGNLYRNSVQETLLHPARLEINRELINGNRSIRPVCKACGLPHYRCVREYIRTVDL